MLVVIFFLYLPRLLTIIMYSVYNSWCFVVAAILKWFMFADCSKMWWHNSFLLNFSVKETVIYFKKITENVRVTKLFTIVNV